MTRQGHASGGLPEEFNLPREVVTLIRRIYDAPFEGFSRFLPERPRLLFPEEASTHLEMGWGLKCLEKTMLFQREMRALGIPCETIFSGYEFWMNGTNLLKIKGSASRPLEEVADACARFYAPDWKTSPYEIPAHLVHRATAFTLDKNKYLVDVTGDVLCPVFCNEAVEALLDARPKPYLKHLRAGLRMYYHRAPPELLRLVTLKERDPDYTLGHLVAGPLFTTGSTVVQPRWFWSKDRYELERKTLAARNSNLEYVRWFDRPNEIEQEFPSLLPTHFWPAAENAWPRVMATISQIFESPQLIKIQLIQYKGIGREAMSTLCWSNANQRKPARIDDGANIESTTYSS